MLVCDLQQQIKSALFLGYRVEIMQMLDLGRHINESVLERRCGALGRVDVERVLECYISHVI